MSPPVKTMVLDIMVEEQTSCACHLIPNTAVTYRVHVQGYSNMYGAEYEAPMTSTKQNHDATCAICCISTRETVLMVPAKTSCPTSWTKEYQGYLMAESKTNEGRSTFIIYVLIVLLNLLLAVKAMQQLQIYTMLKLLAMVFPVLPMWITRSLLVQFAQDRI
jgi:hypothetical protein